MKKILPVALLLLVASCSTTIKNFDQYQKSPLLQAEFMPDPNSIEQKLPSVVIFDFQTEDQNAKRINAGKMVEDSIIEILISNKLAEIQDRKNLTKLQDEIRLSEISGKGISSIKAVDFAIDGNISNVTFSSEFRSADYDFEGRLISPDRYIYTASIQGSLKIYELPSLRVVEAISFSGSETKVEESKDKGIQVGKFKLSNRDDAKKFDDSLAKAAVKKAIVRNSYKIKSAFAKTGYIMEKRTLDDKTIFLVSLGERDGIKQEDKVQIYSKYSDLNVLTGKTEISTKLITSGIVADKTENTKTWIVVKDKQKSSQIRLGDVVKVIYLK